MRGVGGVVVLEKKKRMELLKYAKKNNIPGINNKTTKDDMLRKISEYQILQKRDQIRNDLLDQLERNGIVGEFYVDLINDYMAMWDVKNKLIADIETKGVSIRYQNGENQWGYKKNDSVGELQRTNNQMLRILDHLGLKPSKADTENVDPTDLEM